MSDEELPPGWCAARIEELGDIRLGKQRSPKDHSGDRMRDYLRVANVFDDRIDLSDVMAMNFTEGEERTFGLLPGDILLNEGQSSHLVGRPAMYRGDPGRYCFTNSLIRFRSGAALDPHLALQLFRHMMFSGRFQAVSQITTNIAHLGRDRFAKLPVQIPPSAEQHRIVAKLDELRTRSRKAREALAEVPALLDKLKQSVLAAAFRGDLTAEWRAAHPDVEPARVLLDRIRAERRRRWEEANPRKKFAETRGAARSEVADATASSFAFQELPSTWQIARLRDVLDLQPGYAFKSDWYGSGGVRLLRGTNIVPGSTRWADVAFLPTQKANEYAEYSLQAGDIVIAMDRPIVAGGLKVARLTDADVPALLLQRVGRFRREAAISADFLYIYLQSGYFLHQVSGQSTGTQLPHVSGNDIEAAPIPLPPLTEQAEIARQLSQLFDAINSALQSASNGNKQLDSIDQSILAKAFRGDLVPQDPNDEPADVLLARIQADAVPTPRPTRGRRPASRTPTTP